MRIGYGLTNHTDQKLIQFEKWKEGIGGQTGNDEKANGIGKCGRQDLFDKRTEDQSTAARAGVDQLQWVNDHLEKCLRY